MPDNIDVLLMDNNAEMLGKGVFSKLFCRVSMDVDLNTLMAWAQSKRFLDKVKLSQYGVIFFDATHIGRKSNIWTLDIDEKIAQNHPEFSRYLCC